MVEFKLFMDRTENGLDKLLSAKQPLFDLTIEDLEEITGKEGLDIKLSKEIEAKFKNFAERELELDVDSCSGEEIYKRLMELVWRQNDLVLTKYLKLNLDAGLDDILTACIRFVEKMNLTKSVFKLKEGKAKEMIKKNPPKEIMKLLGYTDVDDLLKKEKLEEVYGALRFAEGDAWLDEFNAQYKDLKPEDFTTGKIEIVQMPLRWAPLTKKFIEKKKHNITHLKELGVVLVLETEDEDLRHGIVLKALPLIVHYFYEVHLYSNFFKLKSKILKGSSFGKVIAETILADPKLKMTLGGEHIHWKVVQRYFGKLEDAKTHPEIFEPHLQPEDLHWDKAELALGKAIPELMVWEDSDYVGVTKDGQLLSLNMMDLTLNFANKNRYKDHLYYHFRESLWNEIFARYMGHKNLEDELLAKLDNALVKPEKLNIQV
jgi:hypothetical protein